MKKYILDSKLPEILPIIKVKSTILMPQAQLPICMSNSSYLEVSSELVEENIVAIVQSQGEGESKTPFKIGCAGQVKEVNFSEDEVTVFIQGLCRFEIIKKLPVDKKGLERIKVSYKKYEIDLKKHVLTDPLDKTNLLSALNLYSRHVNIFPNWEELEKTPTEVLISALAMACPLHPNEKQSLLETVDIHEQSNMITKFIEMNSFDRFRSSNLIN